MTFLKSVLFAAVAVASLQAVASPVSHTVTLEASVPSSDFYVLPKDASWITQTQVLSYSPYTGDLSTLTKQFDVKHTGGAINAKLLSSAVLSSDTASIPLAVKFNNVVLSTTDAAVVTKAAAATASSVNLEISAVRNGDYTPGDYTGNVQLAFDAVL